MPFLTFPVYFVEEDEEEEEKRKNLRLPLSPSKGFISINTQQICAYNEMDNKHVMARLANGDCMELPIGIREFEDIIMKVEIIINIQTNLTEN